MVVEVVSNATDKEEQYGYKTQKEDVDLTLFSDRLIAYIENSGDSTSY